MILLGFKQATVGHTAIGLWRHPDSQSHRYHELGYWTATAQQLEQGGFDGLFVADVLGVLDVHEGKIDGTLRDGVQTPSIDPLLAVSAMAAVTERIGFAITVATTYEQPYLLARKMATLDHLTEGRIGWNVVTAALDSAARNLGLERQLPHAERYRIADEFMTVAYKLWEGSWEDGSVVHDVEAGLFADPAKVHAIAHRGDHFSVPSAFLCEPSVQRTPVLFQAGTSGAGRDFAARHAEGVFLVGHEPELLRPLVDDIRARAKDAGRDPRSLKFLAMVTVVPGETDAAAEAISADYHRYVSAEGALARMSAVFQYDLSTLDPDAPFGEIESGGIRGVIDMITKADPAKRWTPRSWVESVGISDGGGTIVGGPATVADELQRWMDVADLDGFNVTDPMPLVSFREFGRHVMPELQRRGVRPRDGGSAIFRERLLGPGQARARDDHPAARYRVRAASQP